MRLFTAICLPDPAKDALYGAVTELRSQSERGRFTPRENLHLTLVFLGEVPQARVRVVCASMDAAGGSPFELKFGGCGVFARDSGDVYWVGAKPCAALTSLHASLSVRLAAAGFDFDRRPLTAHLTLGREVVPVPGFDRRAFSESVPTVSVPVGSYSLFKSERVGGRMVYTPIYTRLLGASEGTV